MKSQADCWQALLDGKTLVKRNADNEVTLRNGTAIDQFGGEWSLSSPEVWEVKEPKAKMYCRLKKEHDEGVYDSPFLLVGGSRYSEYLRLGYIPYSHKTFEEIK